MTFDDEVDAHKAMLRSERRAAGNRYSLLAEMSFKHLGREMRAAEWDAECSAITEQHLRKHPATNQWKYF